MTREQAKANLIDLGVENPTNAQISMYLNTLRDDREQAVADAIAKKEEEITKKYEGYKSKEDYDKLQNEVNTLKDTNSKNERIGKYKGKGITEKWLDYADTKLKDSKDLDKDLEEFVKNNPELISKGTPTPKPAPKKTDFGKLGSNEPEPKAPQSIKDAVRASYGQE